VNYYEQMQTYLEALAFRMLPVSDEPSNGLGDDRGLTMEQIVITGAAALGAAAVCVVLWVKLKGGAENVTVPAPQAP
jgi:hypothetical protein